LKTKFKKQTTAKQQKSTKRQKNKEHTKTKDNYFFPWVASNNRMANSLYETSLQGIMLVVFITLDWIFVSMNTTTMIPRRHVSQRELDIQKQSQHEDKLH